MNNTLKRAHGKSVEDLPRQLERTKSPSPQQQQLLKICQKMVNMSVKMECSHCSTTFLVTEFYDHLQSIDHESNSDTATKLKSRKRRTHAEGVKRS
jgi:RNA polymerase subunit RPABC4/transcription elongation factor Spt4